MSHGFIGVGPKGWVVMGGFTGFFAYLSQAFKGPDKPKFLVDPEIVDACKLTQPGLVAEHYYNKKRSTQ